MKPKQKGSNFTVFAILTTLTLLTWAAFGAYERLRKIDLSVIPEKMLAPVNPNLDTATLDLLEKKKLVNEEQISSFVPDTQSSGRTQAAGSESAQLEGGGASPSAQTQ